MAIDSFSFVELGASNVKSRSELSVGCLPRQGEVFDRVCNDGLADFAVEVAAAVERCCWVISQSVRELCCNVIAGRWENSPWAMAVVLASRVKS